MVARVWACLSYCALAVAFASPSRAQQLCLFDILQPASRPSLGLGGDPFLSSTRDETGWWSEARAADAKTFRLIGASGAPVPESRTDEHGSFGNNWISSDLTATTRLLDREVVIAATVQNPSWSTSWRGADGQLRLEGEHARLRLTTRVQSLPLGFAVQGTLPLWDDFGWVDARSIRGGVRWNPRDWICGQVDYGRWTPLGEVQSSLYGAEWRADLNCSAATRHAVGRVVLSRRIELEYARTDARYTHDESVSRSHIFQFMPEGTSSRDELSITLRPTPRTRILARGTSVSFEMEGDAFWGGERFGLLSYAHGEVTSLLLAAEHSSGVGSRVLFDVERARASTDGRARFETWPFTETTIDLLGVRRIFRWDLSGDWTRMHIAAEIPLGRAARGSAGVAWHRLDPTGWEENWSPAFLVFGQTDLKQWRMEIDSADLVTVALGVDRMVRGVRLGLEAQQVVYAGMKQHNASAANGDDDDPRGTDQDTLPPLGSTGWPTGGQVRVSVVRSF